MKWSELIYKTSIEIVDKPDRNIPYWQIPWQPYTQKYVLENGWYEGFVRRHNFGRLRVEENRLTYTLDVPEELQVFHAKCWFMFPFEELCIINQYKEFAIQCRKDEVSDNKVEDIQSGKMWRRVSALSTLPYLIEFPRFKINVIKCEPFASLFLYTRHDCSLLELAFVWTRHILPKGKYETVLEFE